MDSPTHWEVLERINLVPERVDTLRNFAQAISAPLARTMPMVILTADLQPFSAQDANRRVSAERDA